jgi:hypothetical protein
MDLATYQKVKQIFDRYGVPEAVWVPIAEMESNLNPNAVGDNGNSIGLFQLNMAGGQGYGYDAEQLKDPVFNASIAAPSIAAAYQAIKDVVPHARLAAETAIRSGHPGGSITNPLTTSAGQAAMNRLIQLQSQFEQSATSAQNALTSALDAAKQQVQNAVNQANPFQPWLDQLRKVNLHDLAISSGLLIFGTLVLLIVFAAILFEHREQFATIATAAAKGGAAAA